MRGCQVITTFKAAKHDMEPDREVTVKVSGKNVGYGSTSECMVQAAIMIVKEREKMPRSGGVYRCTLLGMHLPTPLSPGGSPRMGFPLRSL